MLGTRWEPRSMWAEMNRLRSEMDRLFPGDGLRQFSVCRLPNTKEAHGKRIEVKPA